MSKGRFCLGALRSISSQAAGFGLPSVTGVARDKDPFRILVSCILSLRTKDKTTTVASRRLFGVADTAAAIARMPVSRIEKLIYPVGFYRRKARVLVQASRMLIGRFSGKVPSAFEELLSLPGVGRKTANLVLGLGFGIPAICVDTHVHRISNRLGWVNTRTPEQTERALGRIVPRRWWIRLNSSLVAFGQNICVPVSPLCSLCRVRRYCARVGVSRSR